MTEPGGRDFIVTSHGSSASNWLAYCLNLHPDITCGHSSAAMVPTDPSLLDKAGLGKHIPKLRQGYLQRQNRPVLAVYDELRRAAGTEIVGTVHTYRLRDLPVQQETFPLPAGTFRTVNLVRHPLGMVVASHGQFRDLFRIDLNEFSWTLAKVVGQGLDIVEEVCGRHGLEPGDFDHVCFFAACITLGSLRLDLDALPRVAADPDSPWGYRGAVRMEDVTTSPEAFARLLADLTGRQGMATSEYLDRVFDQGRINVHNRAARPGVEQRWHDLQDWQREAFAAFMHRFGLRQGYESLGYRFDFMDGTG